ncbi:MAG: hypothetical protein PHI37_02110 [Candidatus Gracilibacteria bacterium]|nr:hypothetical protein [Candidatus Gracilibacteria bacterium]
MENRELTTQEKIDYIFETIKKQEKREKVKNIFKWGFRLFMLLYIIYFYFFGYELLLNKMKQSLKINISSENLIQDLKNKINLENNNY